jgi:glutamate-1-semialdehyde 2,1-aminomutase
VPELDRARLAAVMAAEEADFIARHPKAGALHERATHSLLDGVPMNWMVRWAGAYPLYVEEARGAHFTDVDGHDYIDFCLGDTGAMAGHGAEPTIAAVERQLRRGITTMLPTEDAIWAGEELTRRFGLPFWQFTLSATDANRFSLRLARLITGRPLVAVHDRNYHGSVDETFAWLTPDGRVESRRGNAGPQVDPALTTRVVPFNDLASLEDALSDRQVAVLLIEPALTNVGIVLPDEGYLEGVREITRRYGTLLIHDETHTICAGPGGVTGAGGYKPDMLVIGKTIGGGIPVATYGMTAEVASRVRAAIDPEDSDVGGIGGTLAGYALSLAAVRATLGEVLTAEAFERMIPLAERWEVGVNDVLRRHEVPWHVTRLGARAEYHFMATRPRNGREQWDHADPELERFLHLWAMNRGILMTPFHNMALMSPATTEADVDRHTEVFEAAVVALFG